MKPPRRRAAVELFAHDESRSVGCNARRGRLAQARRVRLRRFDQLHAADASVARADLGPPFSDEQLGDTRRDAPQMLAVGSQEIDAWIEGAGRGTLVPKLFPQLEALRRLAA